MTDSLASCCNNMPKLFIKLKQVLQLLHSLHLLCRLMWASEESSIGQWLLLDPHLSLFEACWLWSVKICEKVLCHVRLTTRGFNRQCGTEWKVCQLCLTSMLMEYQLMKTDPVRHIYWACAATALFMFTLLLWIGSFMVMLELLLCC